MKMLLKLSAVIIIAAALPAAKANAIVPGVQVLPAGTVKVTPPADPIIPVQPDVYWGSPSEPFTLKVEGLVQIKRKWAKVKVLKVVPIPVRKSIYYYRVTGGKVKTWPRKINGVPDLREYKEAHPIKHYIIDTCARWQPVINSAASIAIPSIQTFKHTGGNP